MSRFNKTRANSMVTILGIYLTLRGRINFLQMQPYGLYQQSTYRNNFIQEFGCETFKRIKIEENISLGPLLVFDPSPISKSGKHTYGRGKFFSGCAQRPERRLNTDKLATV